MARLDYSRFNGLGDSDSEEEPEETQVASDLSLLSDLPSDLPRDKALVLAARQGQQHLVEALLLSRVQVNARDPHGATALLRAVQLGVANRPVIEALLKASADVQASSDFGETPLSEAAGVGSRELLNTLLTSGNSPSSAILGQALAKASEAQHRSTTRLLLEHQAPPVPDALFGWIKGGDVQMVQTLLEHKASINSLREHDGQSPLVASTTSAAMVQLLCHWRAEVDLPNRKGETPLVAASSNGLADVVSTLLQHHASVEAPGLAMSPLVAAALSGSCSVARCLLAARAALAPEGRRPLAVAAATGSLELCQLLLECRAEPNGAGSAEASPLCIAVAAGHMAFVAQLLDAKADVEQPSDRGSPLRLAAQAGNLEMCQKLLDAGALPTRCDSDGKTALVLSAGIGHRDLCQVLLEAKAQVNDGEVTALHAAAANGHEAVCRALLAARADVCQPGPNGRPAAQLAQRAGYGSLAELLA